MMAQRTNVIVNSWHSRAVAYDALISRWPLFTEMADKLIDALPGGFVGHALDLAGGSGLLSDRLLLRYPQASITLIEPAINMLKLAKQRLGSDVSLLNTTAEHFGSFNLSADAVLCSAAFHLMDESLVFPAIAETLYPGGIFAFNLWGHSFDETVNQEHMVDPLGFLQTAMQEHGETLGIHLPRMATRARSIKKLERCASGSGLELDNYGITEHRTHARFGIEFSAMSENFLGHLETHKRLDVIKRAIELSSGYDLRMSVHFVFRKR